MRPGTVTISPTTEAASGDGLARALYDADLATATIPALPALGQTTDPFSEQRPAFQSDIDIIKAARLGLKQEMARKANALASVLALQVGFLPEDVVTSSGSPYAAQAGRFVLVASGTTVVDLPNPADGAYPILLKLLVTATVTVRNHLAATVATLTTVDESVLFLAYGNGFFPTVRS